ncbi:hypothetical protein PJI17_32380, partial [Mycobacterium kansasii]
IYAGFLEANFIEPAHDKQDFERTALFIRLEMRLKQMILDYWFVTSIIICLDIYDIILMLFNFVACHEDACSDSPVTTSSSSYRV